MGDRVTLLIGTTKGAFFFHSDARRRDWTMTGPHLDGWEVYSLLGYRGRLLAGTSSFVYGTTIRVSDDLGKTWRQIERSPAYSAESGFKLNKIWQIVPGHPSEPDTLYAGVDEAGLFVSRDRGETWSQVDALTRHPTRASWSPGGGGLCLHTIVIDPNDSRRMWVAISAAGVFRTTDGGASWTVCNTGLPGIATGAPDESVVHCVHKIVLGPDQRTLFMQYHGGVLKSTDGADSWTKIENGLPGNFGFPMCRTAKGDLFVVPLDADERRHVPEGRLRVWRSADAGATWRPSENGLGDEPRYVGVLRDAMCADTMDPAGVYFGTSMGEVFWSNDSGDNWQRLPGQLPRITAVKVWAE